MSSSLIARKSRRYPQAAAMTGQFPEMEERMSFMIELTRGKHHEVIVDKRPVSVPHLQQAIEGARGLLHDAQQAGGDNIPDGYRVLDDNGQEVASDWTGQA
jgi:hypothetical protein